MVLPPAKPSGWRIGTTAQAGSGAGAPQVQDPGCHRRRGVHETSRVCGAVIVFRREPRRECRRRPTSGAPQTEYTNGGKAARVATRGAGCDRDSASPATSRPRHQTDGGPSFLSVANQLSGSGAPIVRSEAGHTSNAEHGRRRLRGKFIACVGARVSQPARRACAPEQTRCVCPPRWGYSDVVRWPSCVQVRAGRGACPKGCADDAATGCNRF